MLVALYFISGLVLLYYGADYLVKGGANIALKLKVSPLVIGLTLVAYGTSAPESLSDYENRHENQPERGNFTAGNLCHLHRISDCQVKFLCKCRAIQYRLGHYFFTKSAFGTVFSAF